VYVINDYQLIAAASELYLSNYGKGVKISSQVLGTVLNCLREQSKLEISNEELIVLANQHQIDIESLKKVLINQLNVLKPMLSRKFPAIYIHSDDTLIVELLESTLSREYHCHVVPEQYRDFQPNSLVVFYRKNYSNKDFKTLYQQLDEDIYLITAGVVHKLLVIDNLYFKGSGLPTHFSNLHQLMAYLNSDIPATKNNWLLFYRELLKQQIDQFPEPQINACQRGYIAYCLHQFISQFTNLWDAPTPLDKVNWFWHADLTNFSVHQEIATHSPFSEHDMRVNLQNMCAQEVE